MLVRHHHERWDGRGYPDGLSGTDIPLGSRILAVADSIDAMMSSRSYRPAMTSAACRREIERNSGIMYDPRVAAAALEHWDALVGRYAAENEPQTPYFDRLQLEHTRQVHDYLVAHQSSHITLPELAARFHLSQSSLKICFKALYGVPVASYLRALRMDTAARLFAGERPTSGRDCPSRRVRGPQPVCCRLPPPYGPPPHRAAPCGLPHQGSAAMPIKKPNCIIFGFFIYPSYY